MKHHHSQKKIIILGLVILAVILGGVLYKQKKGGSSEASNIKPEKSVQATKAPQPSGTPIPGTELAYLFSIKNDSPEEEKKRHFEYAVSISQESEYLDVTECNINPIVLRVKDNTMIKLKNDGQSSVNLIFDVDHRYLVPPQTIKSIKAEFGKGDGLYGYGCHGIKETHGMVFVTAP